MKKSPQEIVVDIVREHGTEKAIKASLCSGNMIEKIVTMLARLIRILEKKHDLRRGHVVSMICAAQGLEEESKHEVSEG